MQSSGHFCRSAAEPATEEAGYPLQRGGRQVRRGGAKAKMFGTTIASQIGGATAALVSG